MIILFDGVCNLCSAWVLFVIRRDPKGRFKFAALQSAVATDMLRPHDISAEAMRSIVLIDGSRCLTKSDAVLEIARGLSTPWPLFGSLRLIPRFVRDAAYDFVARHRYHWFGKRGSCMVPTAELRSRFLDG